MLVQQQHSRRLQIERVKKTRFDFTLRVVSSSIIHYRCEPESFAIII